MIMMYSLMLNKRAQFLKLKLTTSSLEKRVISIIYKPDFQTQQVKKYCLYLIYFLNLISEDS